MGEQEDQLKSIRAQFEEAHTSDAPEQKERDREKLDVAEQMARRELEARQAAEREAREAAELVAREAAQPER